MLYCSERLGLRNSCYLNLESAQKLEKGVGTGFLTLQSALSFHKAVIDIPQHHIHTMYLDSTNIGLCFECCQ